MPSRLPRARSLAVLACVAALPVLATSTTSATAGTVSAHAARTCSHLPSKPTVHGYGGYFQTLRVTGLGCTSGKKVMKHHDACRTQKSRQAYCAHVDGYKCTERRSASNGVEFDSVVTCKKGSKKVVYSYQQDIA